MKPIGLILLLFSLSIFAVAQDEPYYKDLSKRDRKDLKFLPNLETSKTRFYASADLAFRFQGSSIESTSLTRYEAKRVNNLNYGGAIGINFNDNWYYDLGISANPMYMQTEINASIAGQRSFSISSGSDFTAYSLTVRKKVWQIDKVTENAALLLTAGILVSPVLNNNIHEDRSIRLGVNSINGSPPDTANYRIITRSDKIRLIPQLGFEISGKIVEQVEVGLYSKLSLQSKGTLFNDLIFGLNSEPVTLSRQDTGVIGFDFGILLRWNLINWVNYKSKVE